MVSRSTLVYIYIKDILYNSYMNIKTTQEKFYKVGRIYWINPKPIPGMKSKRRPAIVLNKYDGGKTIFIHLGSSEYKEKSSIAVNHLIWKALDDYTFRNGGNLNKSYAHLDASKPEWNTSVIKPHLENGKYIDIDNKVMKKIRYIYTNRTKELEAIRIKKAKVNILNGNENEAFKQLDMLKDKDPFTHKRLEPTEWVRNFKKNN